MHPMLTIAVRAARRAGSIINRASLNGGALNVRSKRVNDFVTQVDQAAEEAIIEIVRKAHPDHGFLEIGRATSELQSRLHLVCRLLLEKKKNHHTKHDPPK